MRPGTATVQSLSIRHALPMGIFCTHHGMLDHGMLAGRLSTLTDPAATVSFVVYLILSQKGSMSGRLQLCFGSYERDPHYKKKE
jgi:hypothetical protein